MRVVETKARARVTLNETTGGDLVHENRQEQQQTLLLVDDDDGVRRTLTALLELCGYRVLAASSASDALKLAVPQPRPVALVTDVHMPDVSGIELVSRLLRAGIDLPVLFLSGVDDTRLPTDWPASVPRNFLPKPFTPEVLAAEIRALLGTPPP